MCSPVSRFAGKKTRHSHSIERGVAMGKYNIWVLVEQLHASSRRNILQRCKSSWEAGEKLEQRKAVDRFEDKVGIDKDGAELR